MLLQNAKHVKEYGNKFAHVPDVIYRKIDCAINGNYADCCPRLVELLPDKSTPSLEDFDVTSRKQRKLARFLLYVDLFKKLKPRYTQGVNHIIRELLEYIRTSVDYRGV